MTIKKFIEQYNNNEFENSDHDTQVRAGWCDWFCLTRELSERLKNIYHILSKIKNDNILDNYALAFSNKLSNDYHTTYDKISFVPLGDYKKYFNILIDCPYHNKRYALYIEEYDFTNKIEFDDIEKLIEFIDTYQWE